MSAIDLIAARTQKAEEILKSLQNEFSALKNELVKRELKQITNNNIELTEKIHLAKLDLVKWEKLRGKKQYSIPDDVEREEHIAQKPKEDESSKICQDLMNLDMQKKKLKKTPDLVNKRLTENHVAHIGQLDFRIGRIIDVSKHPEADNLYVEKIDCGDVNGISRTVVSGLVKFIPIEEMRNRLVVVLCNLKPLKMRGITSEAMVMCASTTEKVEVLSPPKGSIPGDLVYCKGYDRNPDPVLNPKKKIFETCAPDLLINDNYLFCYKGSPFHVDGKGEIVSQTLINVPVK